MLAARFCALWTLCMNIKDYIGERGEVIFIMLITKWCDKRPWFQGLFLGAKAEAKDYLITLVEPTSGDATGYVQVKATNQGYFGKGKNRKLKVGLTKKSLKKLQATHSPTYVVGIDIEGERGYILPITSSMNKGFSRLPTVFPLNCKTIKALWKEIDDYWKNKPAAPAASTFS